MSIQQFQITTEFPKRSKKKMIGVLSVGKDGCAMFFEGKGERKSSVLAEMANAKLVHASSHVMLLSGMQPNGFTKSGTQNYFYQEWALRYVVQEEK